MFYIIINVYGFVLISSFLSLFPDIFYPDCAQTFVATENAIVLMLDDREVFPIAHGNCDFLINYKHKTAVLLLFAVNKRFTNPYDIVKRISSIRVVYK